MALEVVELSGWLGLISSRAWRQGAGMVHLLTGISESDASRPERSCGSLGRNKRPCEKQDKAAA